MMPKRDFILRGICFSEKYSTIVPDAVSGMSAVAGSVYLINNRLWLEHPTWASITCYFTGAYYRVEGRRERERGRVRVRKRMRQ